MSEADPSAMEPRADSISAARPAGTRTQNLAMFHPLAQGVFPLFIRADDHLLPIGTAFCVSGAGLVVAATHCIAKAMEVQNGRPVNLDTIDHFDLHDVGLSILHLSRERDTAQAIIVSAFHGSVARPTDLTFLSLDWDQAYAGELPAAVTVSPIMPGYGSPVRTVGCCNYSHEALPMREIESGRFDWRAYSHELRVSEGVAGPRFVRSFAGYLRAPCFQTTCATVQGQSGGPVFNKSGHVCGMNSSSGNLFFDPPSSLASSIYPALGLDVEVAVKSGGKLERRRGPFAMMIREGLVRSDGSEALHRMEVEGSGAIRIDPPMHRDDLPFTYDSYMDYQEKKPAVGRDLTGSGEEET